MKWSKHYGLRLPERGALEGQANDPADIEDLTYNFGVMDAELARQKEEDARLEREKAARTELAAHAERTDNPHGVTKAQVGLGSVPNVTTNGQTPTYTEAAAAAALVSGETLAAALGKLAAAVRALLAHLADGVRHITAAERTAWNGKTTVSFVRSLTGGTKVGTLTINGTATDLYCETDTDTTYGAATQSAAGLMSAADKKKLDGVAAGANAYSLPAASDAVRGGVKTGYAANGKKYPVKLDGEKMYVEVPWTDTNTTYGTMGAATQSAAGKAGLVPAPAAGAQGKYLRGDGTWQTPDAVSGNAASATKLATARSICTNLAGSAAASFDGTANVTPGVTGVLPMANGGTGNASGKAASAETAERADTVSVSVLGNALKKKADIQVGGSDVSEDGKGMSLLQIITKSSGDYTISNLSSDALLKAFLLAAHPVGSYYWSSVSTSPATLFGGTWTQVKDRFVLAAGDTYKVNATGGEAAHTLTVNEMPAHRHTLDHTKLPNGSASAWTTTVTNMGGDAESTTVVGGGAAHNNMPPYLVAYCWRRTA